MQDNELLTKYATFSDEAAFEEVVSRYLNLVYGVAWRSTGDESTAEEITQNTFAILARKASQLGKHGSLGGWLMRTARLEAKKALRTEYRRKRKVEALAKEPKSEPIEDTDEAAWNRALPHLDEALEQLATRDREIIAQRFYCKMKFREIAEQTGSTEDSARKHLSRALDRLSAILSSRCGAFSAGVIALGLTTELTKANIPVTVSSVASASLVAAPKICTLTLITNAILTMTHYKTRLTAVLATVSIASIAIIWLLSHAAAQEENEKRAQERLPDWVASIEFIERLELDYSFRLIFIDPEVQFSRRTPTVKNWFLDLNRGNTTGDGRFKLVAIIPPGDDPEAEPGQAMLIDTLRVDGNPLKIRFDGQTVSRPEFQTRIRNKSTGKENKVGLNEKVRIPGVKEELTVSAINEDSVEISFREKDGKTKRKVTLKK